MDTDSYLLKILESISNGKNYEDRTVLCAHYAVLRFKGFQRLGYIEDLKEVIEKGRTVVEAIPKAA